jgi:dipeptidyl aminopeptidase/acylaminoacyl peptidase
MTPVEAPYGTWESQITPERLVEQVVRLGQLQVHGDDIYWVESRPSDGGRQVIVRWRAGQTQDVIPPGFYARTQVHEYGGRCYAVSGKTVVFSNWSDQRLWVTDGGEPRALTGEPERGRAVRFADPVFSRDGLRLYCVRERHRDSSDVVNDLVSLVLEGGGPPRVVAEGHDFYAAPRVSPSGDRICWVTWDLPDMPWDSTNLWVAGLAPDGQVSEPTIVAGGPGESVTQPRWSPEGVLHYVSDRSGWWNIYDEGGRSLCAMDAEFGRPDWVFGVSSYGFRPDGELIAVWESGGGHHLGRVREGRATEMTSPFNYLSAIEVTGAAVVAIAASPTDPPAVVRFRDGGSADVLRRSHEQVLDTRAVSVPRHVRFATGDAEHAYALVYLPVNPRFVAPAGERPPVVVVIHGGPTSSSVPVFDRSIQYWTSRGFAVADVDYRGSTGYGRAFRDRLRGGWGITDVEDCASVVAWLDAQGLVDAGRAVIRGGSAGGFTTLAALAFTDAFAAGASHFGVADLESLARHTHKFESHYLDSLIGRWPDEEEEYRRRSPIHNLDRFSRPLILFQGAEDAVVPAEQSRMMFDALKERGVEVEYIEFEGEQHGFRKAETIIEVATRELEFFRRVLGLELSPPA